MQTSETAQRAQAFGITYRSEDYDEVVILNGDSAIYAVRNATNKSLREYRISVERAWTTIARQKLQLVK